MNFTQRVYPNILLHQLAFFSAPGLNVYGMAKIW
jgi:hypothetical protein